jgi:hypothetical protein
MFSLAAGQRILLELRKKELFEHGIFSSPTITLYYSRGYKNHDICDYFCILSHNL